MSRYKAYPEYKDSGVEWLGKVPREWKLCPLKFMARIKNGQDYKSVEADEGYPVIGSGGQFSYASQFTYKKASVLLGRKGTIDKPLYINEPFWTVDTMYYTEINEDIEPKFLYYLALTIQFSRYATNTALPSMTQENLGNYVFAIPTNGDSRKKIVAFLDHETAKIDALIEKQQRLIELLKEKRQAVISHAVTKGLNPNAPMRDSGVEWLGEVPARWRITQIKYVAELNPRKALVELKPSLECNFVPMEKLKTESLLLDEIRTVVEVISGYTCFCDEDILMAKVTPCFENGNIAIARGLKNGVGFGSTEIYVLRTVKHVSNSFLLYRLQENEFMRMATGAMTGAGGLKRVPTDFVNSFKFAIPPVPEQLEICSFIEKQKKRYDSLESLARNQVELLQERRTALISAAVTGKIDVRYWQATA